MSVISILYYPYRILRDEDSYFNLNINMNTVFLWKHIKKIIETTLNIYRKKSLRQTHFLYIQVV
jgi:hypothetical protein